MNSKEIIMTVLGCGSSSGTPVINCHCSVCVSKNVKNIRTRSSLHIMIKGWSFIIDTGPDFRSQMLREKISRIDGVFYTHFHADHINGLDDLRSFCFYQKEAINVYGMLDTIEIIKNKFDYAFLDFNNNWNRPVLKANILKDGENIINNISVFKYDLPHGKIKSSAFKIGKIAWLTDINFITDEVIANLQDLDFLFLDCLMYDKYPSHLSVDESFHYAKILGAKNTYLIHLTHILDYNLLSKKCPKNVYVAYDGLKLFSSL